MKFYDIVEVKLQAGKGGDGIVAGRREKFVPFGGPAWWDWWKWGDIIFIADEGETTLLPFKYKSEYKAEDWQIWKWSEQAWKKWQDLVLKVPVWTIVIDKSSWKIVYQFKKHWDKFIAARGWRWWLGNINFKTSTRQFPQFALLGEPWEYKEYILELQLLADVALIGFPNVWKSTFINSISKVKAKVADYPFTTLVPNLWIVDYKNNRFSIVDIPGIILDAHKGKWLGLDFLRHVLKAKIWIFILDLQNADNLFEEFKTLFEEIKIFIKNKFLLEYKNIFSRLDKIDDIYFEIKVIDKYIFFDIYAVLWDKKILIFRKAILWVFNKKDVLDDEEVLQFLKDTFAKHIADYLNLNKQVVFNNTFIISAATKQGINIILDEIIDILKIDMINEGIYYDVEQNIEDKKDKYVLDITNKEIDKLIEGGYIEENEAKYLKVWEVFHPLLTYLVWVLPWWNDEAEMWFWEKLSNEWVTKWLENYWVRHGDILKILDIYWNSKEPRYIVYQVN